MTALLAGRERVTEAVWAELVERLAPVSESYLRRLVRTAGLPMDPMVEGVRQDSLPELERTLVALQQEYEQAAEAGNRERLRRLRSIVIQAKDHARLAARRPGADKDEAIRWMLVWLENPPVFSLWVAARKRAADPHT